MQTKLGKLEKNRVLLELEADPKEVADAFHQAYRKVVQKLTVPGFRKGKTPRKVLEQHYGKDVFLQDATEILVTRGYYEALIEHKLEPVDHPEIDFSEPLEEGKSFKFQAKVEVLPEVELGEYKGIALAKANPVVTDEEIEAELKALQERHAELVGADKTVLEKGDFAVIDFEGYLDGEPFPGGAAQGYTLEVGSGSFIPGFEEGLLGMALGEEREVKATFPEDYPQTTLAGKEAVFKVKLHEIKVKEYPVLDDEFAQSLGNFKTMEELKEDLKKRRLAEKEYQAAREFEDQVVEKAVEGSKVELTDTLIDRELNYLIHNMEHDFEDRGLKLEEYLKYSNKTLADLRAELRPQAERRVKTDLVLSAIAKAEGITVSEDEIKERLEYLLQFYSPATQEKMMKEQKENVVERIRSSLEREKTVKLLVDAVQKPESEEKEKEVKTE